MNDPLDPEGDALRQRLLKHLFRDGASFTRVAGFASDTLGVERGSDEAYEAAIELLLALRRRGEIRIGDISSDDTSTAFTEWELDDSQVASQVRERLKKARKEGEAMGLPEYARPYPFEIGAVEATEEGLAIAEQLWEQEEDQGPRG